ncbi:MAG TPA: hypothetical protein VHT70_02280 [Candidatus Saccharimonadales bacterium]|jgi:hypothetical protein|nr:hypothetical protein [Candidatus Saccharimonadales bacterium]
MNHENRPTNDNPYKQRALLIDMLRTCYAANADKAAIELRRDGMRATLYGTVSLQLHGTEPSHFNVVMVDASERTKSQYYVEMTTIPELSIAPRQKFSIDNNAENLDRSTAHADRQLRAMVLPKAVFRDARAELSIPTAQRPDDTYVGQLLDEDIVMRDFYVDIARKRHDGETF